MPKVSFPYELNGNLVTGNGSLIPICSLSNRSLLPSLTVPVLSFFQILEAQNDQVLCYREYIVLLMQFVNAPQHQSSTAAVVFMCEHLKISSMEMTAPIVRNAIIKMTLCKRKQTSVENGFEPFSRSRRALTLSRLQLGKKAREIVWGRRMATS